MDTGETRPLRLEIWTDGCHSGYGVVIKDEQGNPLRELAGAAPPDVLDQSATEYMAVILGLQEAKSLGAVAAHLHIDSDFVVRQLNGDARVRSTLMAKYHSQALQAADGIETTYEWIPGESNGDADRLSRLLSKLG